MKYSANLGLLWTELKIDQAILQAKKNDLVLIAGKGHEKYQILGEKKIPFEDIKEAHKALAKRKERNL